MADKQDSAFVQATRSVFPRLPTEIIVSIVRLLVWLTTLSFVEHAPQVLRLPLIFIWFAVFLARYVLGSAKDPERRQHAIETDGESASNFHAHKSPMLLPFSYLRSLLGLGGVRLLQGAAEKRSGLTSSSLLERLLQTIRCPLGCR
jgi:hypothetical protein